MTLYRVRFPFCINVQAANSSAAYAEAVKVIKAMPVESLISSIEDASTPRGPLLKRLITGK